MKATASDIVHLRSLAIFCSAAQNGSSRLMLVFRPRRTIERLVGLFGMMKKSKLGNRSDFPTTIQFDPARFGSTQSALRVLF
jgi:hypothetical protein